MHVIDLIQAAGSAQEVLGLLSAYVDGLRAADVLPEWWLRLPLEDPEGARRHLLGLMAIVNTASRRLDHGRCMAAKEALSVFAVGTWRCNLFAPRPAAASGAARPVGVALRQDGPARH
jgi:hypothetical protein